MAVSYEPYFLWTPRRLVNGRWAWMRTVQRVRTGGQIEYRFYADKGAS